MKETDETTKSFDPNDTRQITFMVDREESEWIDDCLDILQEYDAEFYVRIIGIGDDKYLYKITTKHRNLQHEDYKKFEFKMQLKFGNEMKIR